MPNFSFIELFNLLLSDSKLHLMERIPISRRLNLHNLHSIQQNHSNWSSFSPTIIKCSHPKLHSKGPNSPHLLIPLKLLKSWQPLIDLLCIVAINRLEFFVFTSLWVNQGRLLNGQILEISNNLLLNDRLRGKCGFLFARSCKVNRLIVFDTIQFYLALVLLQWNMMLSWNSQLSTEYNHPYIVSFSIF